ncbi:MAG: glycine cleavage system protein R [Candidatus Krumholzibacteriia bacterium]
MTQLVITIVGDDRPGIVESLAAVVADHGGNWLSSSLSDLAGQFAGIIEVAVDDSRCDDLAAAIGALPGLQVHSVKGRAASEPSGESMATLDVVGVDQPGIVRRLTLLLKNNGVNLLQFASWTESAPNSGDELFRAVAEFELTEAVDLDSLSAGLEDLADDMALEIELELDDDEGEDLDGDED